MMVAMGVVMVMVMVMIMVMVVVVVVQQHSDMAVGNGQGRGQRWSECTLVLRRYCVGAFWLHQAGARALQHRRCVE